MKKILIVDDSSMIRMVVSKASKKAGYEVLVASDGQEGLSLLLREPAVDLILSDVNMPIMDGLEMVSQIKKQDSLKYIPIVMLTTEVDEKLKDRARELGVKAWMVKPFDKKIFLKALKKLIG